MSSSQPQLGPVAFPIGRLNQFLYGTVLKTLQEQLPTRSGQVQISGYLGRYEEKLYGDKNPVYLGVPLTESLGPESEGIKLKIPKTILEAAQITAGEYVTLVGLLSVFQYSRSSSFEFQIEVREIRAAEGSSRRTENRTHLLTVSSLKTLGFGRRPFPETPQLQISVIHPKSRSSSVLEDFLVPVRELGSYAQFEELPTNVHDAEDLSRSIAKASGNILVLIRGGGEETDLSAFDDARVVKALCSKPVYRISGIGHAGDSVLADLVSDHVAATPSHAGTHIRDTATRFLQREQRSLAVISERDRLAAENDRLHDTVRQIPTSNRRLIRLAFVAGLFLTVGFLLARWLYTTGH